ncbi:MAG: cytochrome P450 [Mycobacteriales bacterium]
MVTAAVGVAAVVVVVATLPYWLPGRVVALRTRLFTRINGSEGIPVPGPTVGVEDFLALYAHPAADGRSRGAALSDLFWYWLSPGPEVHQEHLEPGERYDEVARATRRVLAVPRAVTEELTARCADRVLAAEPGGLVRLRDLMMPVWAEVFYELVFAEPCPADARALIVGNADDVVTALKCCGLRHLRRRHALTAYLEERVRAGEVAHPPPAGLSVREQAYYLQGTFFNTAVVQMSEAMAHLLMAIAQHPEVQARLVAEPGDDRYLNHVIDEALRRYPLFGIAHRITSDTIEVGGQALPAGSVLCFSYPDYHRVGYADPDRFDPDRWDGLAVRDAHHIPFGVTANRACPARGIAPVMMRVAARRVLHRYALHTTAGHTRSIPNRGPCLLVPRTVTGGRARRAATLGYLRLRDRWEDVWRSLVQLVLGGYLVWDARRQRLCSRYFEAAAPVGEVTGS